MRRERMAAGALGAVALLVLAGQMGGGREPAAGPLVVNEAPLRVAAGTPEAVWAAKAEAEEVAQAEVPVLPEAPDPCAVKLEVFPEDGAMLGLTMQAPCQPDARVIVAHGGVEVAMRTMATGSLFTSIPAMEPEGRVELRFADGTVARGAAEVPELAAMRRFAVIWQGGDRLELNAFEGEADYGDAGHKTAQNGGVMLLGDPMAAPAQMAEVYTFPDPQKARITLEAEVTAQSCGREFTGRTVYAADGAVRGDALTLSLPQCDGAGGFVVLNNPLPDMTLAAAQ